GTPATSGGYVGCQRTMAVTALPCEDARTVGTRTTVTDDSSITATLPFTFNFYGTPRTSILLSSSGVLTFNGLNPGVTNACLPTGTTYPMLAPFGEHIQVSAGGLYAATTGPPPNRRYIVQWYGVVYLSGTTLIDVRAVL